jgi:hypothetical protein
LPVALLPDVTVIQAALLAAVQAHVLSVATVTVLAPPLAATEALSGVIV